MVLRASLLDYVVGYWRTNRHPILRGLFEMAELDQPAPLPRSVESAPTAVRLPDLEIDLPDDATKGVERSAGSRSSSLLSSLMLGVATVGLLGGAGWFLLRGAVGEQMHPNWKHVDAAESASLADDAHRLTLLGEDGLSSLVEQIDVREADIDRRLSRKVSVSVRRGNLETAREALQAAQPDPVTNLATTEMLAGMLGGDTNVYRLELWDCCDNDGDAVDILVNGVTYLTVPLTNQRVSVAIPLCLGPNQVSLRGAQDGRGGVTVGIKTSAGAYINRKLRVGHEYAVRMVAP